jgi:hypothetical protein
MVWYAVQQRKRIILSSELVEITSVEERRLVIKMNVGSLYKQLVPQLDYQRKV